MHDDHDDDVLGASRHLGVDDLIAADDVTGLMRRIDAFVADRRWDDLTDLARRCRDAAEYGRQLWPVALHADYRAALEGPAAVAAAVLSRPPSRFTPGPLTEVVSARHDWHELAGCLDDPHAAAAVAQERVLRGEDLRDDDAAAGTLQIGEVPLVAAPDETAEDLLPVYRPDAVHVPDADVAEGTTVVSATHAADVGDERSAAARRVFHGLFETWLTESNGVLRTVTAPGDTPDDVVGDIAADLACVEVTPGRALALLTWAAASGGAHGRRRGGAAGRLQAWWAAASLCGARDDWPPSDADTFVLDVMAGRRWWWWQPVPRPSGWLAGVAVGDPVAGLVHAALAVDDADGAAESG